MSLSCRRAVICGVVTLLFGSGYARADALIKHSFFAAGVETYILDDDGKVVWRYPQGTRDGWVLPNGNDLLAVTKNKE